MTDSHRSVQFSLRDVTKADLPFLFEHQADADAARVAALASRGFEAFMAHWTKILADPSIHKQTVMADGIVAGNIVIFRKAGKREVGYWLGREHWGKGLATFALGEILRTVTERPLYAHVAEQNAASLRVLEKCGFLRIAEDSEFSTINGQSIKGLIFRIG